MIISKGMFHASERSFVGFCLLISEGYGKLTNEPEDVLAKLQNTLTYKTIRTVANI